VHGKKRKACRVLVGNSDGRKPSRRTSRWKVNIKAGIRVMG
jgi:hypothetical protein